MQCTLLNRNYPPAPGITGQSANELAGYLEKAGIEVHVITTGGDYSGGGAMDTEIHGSVHRLKHVYNGKNKFLRLLSSLFEGWKMARKAAKLNKGPLISMTDPPLLNFWVSRLAKRKSIPWIYWSMDLYPEAFVAGGLVKSNNWVYKYVKRQLKTSSPNRLIALGNHQAQFIQKDYSEPIETIVLPCGISKSPEQSSIPKWAEKDGRILFGYIGNIGEAHDARFVKSFITNIDPTRHRFILVAYGSQSRSVLEYAKWREGVVVLNNLPREYLTLIDVHLVSLRSEWNHICVPSKAVSAVCEGASIYICCSALNDNWALLKDAGWRVDADANFTTIISTFLDQLTLDAIDLKRSKARALSKKLQLLKDRAFTEIAESVISMG